MNYQTLHPFHRLLSVKVRGSQPHCTTSNTVYKALPPANSQAPHSHCSGLWARPSWPEGAAGGTRIVLTEQPCSSLHPHETAAPKTSRRAPCWVSSSLLLHSPHIGFTRWKIHVLLLLDEPQGKASPCTSDSVWGSGITSEGSTDLCAQAAAPGPTHGDCILQITPPWFFSFKASSSSIHLFL